MAWDIGNSNASLRRDIERWQNDLVMFERAGLGKSGHADDIRGWIAVVEKLITYSRH